MRVHKDIKPHNLTVTKTAKAVQGPSANTLYATTFADGVQLEMPYTGTLCITFINAGNVHVNNPFVTSTTRLQTNASTIKYQSLGRFYVSASSPGTYKVIVGSGSQGGSQNDTILLFVKNQTSEPNLNIGIFQVNLTVIAPPTEILWQSFQMPQTIAYEQTLFARVTVNGGTVYTIPVYQGNAYSVTAGGVSQSGTSGQPSEFDIRNDLPDPIDISILRSGASINDVTGVVNGQTESYQFNPSVWIGDTAVAQGQPINPGDFNTQLSFLGIATADIVVTGTPGNYSYSIANVIFS